MKKFIALSLLALSILGAASIAEAKTSEPAKSTIGAAQIRIQVGRPGNRRFYRRVRIVNSVRTVRGVGGRLFRETVQTRYQPNGRVTTRVISRVRIR